MKTAKKSLEVKKNKTTAKAAKNIKAAAPQKAEKRAAPTWHDTYRPLYRSALKALANSYAPYSKFNVSSAVLTTTGKIFNGCNVENASYGGTICAERVAINKSVSEGFKKFKAILVMTKQKHAVSPCGLCGQTMLEFFSPNTPVILANNKEILGKFRMKDLYPHGFTGKQLKST
jgi:cytidine deaminase